MEIEEALGIDEDEANNDIEVDGEELDDETTEVGVGLIEEVAIGDDAI